MKPTKQYISRERLITLGFREFHDQKDVFYVKRNGAIVATIGIDKNGFLLNSTGIPKDRLGNIVLYRRF